ncbi:TonB-dependent receptor plug domain-containing protein [Aquimarina sp. W85]|uniref:TonB-dependent receptor plug domain-containing protein n=1 Tax=Aquimarina rhodophyticola TaxID=3342246 RepID=UPI0036729442
MNKKTMLGTALCIWAAQLITSQETTSQQPINELEEVVISDSKFDLKREQSGKIITKITAQELKRSQGQSVATVLNRVAGIYMNGSNNAAGAVITTNVRGGGNRQVVVRVDGVTVTDPSNSSGAFDLRLLSVNQIESIEILKGSSSTLYGSGAATAVINITLKKESKDRISANFESSIGSNQSQEEQDYDIKEFTNAASVNGTLGKFYYLASFGNQYSGGLSEAEPFDDSSDTFEKDFFNKYNVYTKAGYKVNDRFRFHLYGTLDNFENTYDKGAGADGNNSSNSKQKRIGSQWEYASNDLSFTFVDSYALTEKKYTSDFYVSDVQSRLYTFDAYSKYTFKKSFYTVIGVNGAYSDYKEYSASNRNSPLELAIDNDEADFDIVDPYLNVVYTSKFGLNVNAGVRLNIHSEYGTHLVYSLNPSYTYEFGDNYLKGLASYSSAYITPSLYQLYAPIYGNLDLNPEENITIEGGVELSLNKKTRISAVYFRREEQNFVDFVDLGDFVFQYQNVEEDFNTSGIEVEIGTKVLNDKLQLSGNFTYTKVDEDLSQIRIPEMMFNVSTGYQVNDKTFTSLSYRFNDDREDSFFNATTFEVQEVTLDSFGLLDFYINHKLLSNMNIFASVSNITNEDFQESFGYSTRGRNAKIGFSLNF